MTDVNAPEGTPEQIDGNEVEKPKRKYEKSWKKKGAAPVRMTVAMTVHVPRAVHDELKRFAVRTRMPMPRLLLETFVESLPPEIAIKMREVMGPIATSQRRMEAAHRSMLRNARDTCPTCRKTHEMMPGPGPWHMPSCHMHRTRPSVWVDGEKE